MICPRDQLPCVKYQNEYCRVQCLRVQDDQWMRKPNLPPPPTDELTTAGGI